MHFTQYLILGVWILGRRGVLDIFISPSTYIYWFKKYIYVKLLNNANIVIYFLILHTLHA